MNFNKITIYAVGTVLAAATLSSCNIYKKFDMPDDSALAAEYKKAREAEVDSAAFGNMRWQDVFTDPCWLTS